MIPSEHHSHPGTLVLKKQWRHLALSKEGNQQSYVLPGSEPSAPSLLATALFSPIPNSEWLIQLHFHGVSLGSELMTVYEVPPKPVWTITELNKHIEKLSFNNEGI